MQKVFWLILHSWRMTLKYGPGTTSLGNSHKKNTLPKGNNYFKTFEILEKWIFTTGGLSKAYVKVMLKCINARQNHYFTPGVFHLLKDKQFLPGCCRYHAATCWWYESDRCLGPGQRAHVEMSFPVCTEPHRNLWSPARQRSHGKDNVQLPHSTRATNGSMEKLLYNILGSTDNL